MKTKPTEAWDALLKEVLKGDSKPIWHGEKIENLSPEEPYFTKATEDDYAPAMRVAEYVQ